MCIPEAKSRLIDADLRRYPIVLKENKKLRKTVSDYAFGAKRDSVALTAKDSVIAATERRVYFTGLLRQDADARAAVYQAKARKRSWIIVALSVVLVAVTYTAVAR